ncbi:MAG: CHASE domain-containing protein [Syntrophobacteraceae bacterium]|jgi:PAS domain S-box-containing protein
MKENPYSHGTALASFIAILGIAAAYFALARLCLLLAIPPGYASAIWPAAGLALAAALLWGYRVWVGVWLGSFAANLWTVLNAGSAILSVSTVLAAVIGSAAALQAVFGAYLIFRFVGCPLNLYRLQDVVRFLLLGGPLSCLVNASISVSCLWLAGAISVHDFWFNWFTWWVGDATGAMLLTPVVLSLSVKHGEIWKLRRNSVALPLCLLLFLIVSLYVFVSHKEQQRIENEFKLKAGMIASQTKEEWDAHLDALCSEAAFFSAYSQVDRDKFRAFSRYWLARHQSIQALEWIPRVLHAERSGYEKAARRDGYPDFRITESTKQGLLVERTPQPEYFPVYYVEPYEGNEKALGFDLSSDQNRMSALNQALMTGKPVGTSRITLVQEKADQYSFLVFMPVYGRKTSNPGDQELREALRGFALGVFRIGDAMRVVVGEAKTQGIRLQLTDLTADKGEQLLYDLMPATPAGDDSKTTSQSVTSVAPWLATTLEIAERRWQLSFSPTADYLAKHRSLQAWSVLVGGLIFAAGACALLLVVTGRTARTEVLVSDRTTALEMEITERRQAEDELRRSQRQLADIIEFLPDATFVINNAGKVIAWNRAMKEMTGISRSKMIGKGDFEYSLPFFGDRRPLLIDLVFASEEKKMEYYDSVSKVGGSIVAESYAPETYGGKGAYLWGAATALFDDQGNVTGAIETMRDITERKQAQDELFNSRQMLRSVFDNIPQRVFWKDRSSVFVGCNKSLALDAGYKDPSELVGKTDYEHASAATADRYRADDREVMESGRSKLNYEEPQIRPDGSQAWLITSKVPMYDQDGQVIGVLGTYSDITERKLAEDALRESEERFSRFFRSTPVGTSITRLSDGQFMDANDAFLGLSGYTREETVGHSALELGLWANTEDRSKMLKTLEEQGRLQDFETLFRRKSGEIMDVLISAEVMEMAGQQYMLGLTHDITERKRGEEERKKLEEQLFQAQKIESVGRLAGGVAHDFNNMLGVIIGRAEMALGQDVSPDKLQHHLEEILKAGLRSAALTRQLLAFARKQTAVAKILHLNDTISGMLKMLRRLIGEDIDLLWVPGLDLWNVKIDPSQVDQILANLVVNARDAISGVGAVTMRTENVVIDDSKRAETLEFIPGEYVLLTVSDTGTGMSREVCEMIFEPFFTTKEMGKGTGLGLSTVYGIVKQNDGFICVASEPGKGTTFKIYLPRFEVETEQVPSEEITVKRLTGTETILLVEDDEAILDLGKTILENLGYTVLAAQAPADSIRIAEEHPGDIHLLITDVVMPEMNGRELAEQLSTIRPNLECLYMSGYTADVMAHRGILDKGLNFIQKPFGSDDLAVRVRQVLDHLE